jgi:hypothetical protein
MRASGRRFSARCVVFLGLLVPLGMGADCSTNAVAQTAATTAANTFVTQLITTIFNQLNNAGGGN